MASPRRGTVPAPGVGTPIDLINNLITLQKNRQKNRHSAKIGQRNAESNHQLREALVTPGVGAAADIMTWTRWHP
jgi:imidazoleglycerol phosphate synthase glutamine amidotransferase subunit HisH